LLPSDWLFLPGQGAQAATPDRTWQTFNHLEENILMRIQFMAVVLALMLALAACGGNDDSGSASELDLLEATAVADSMELDATPTAEILGDVQAFGDQEEGEQVAGGAVLLPEVDPLDTRGNIVTAGSSTVFPLTERMAARFENEGYSGTISIDSIGSGAGFERFCVAGETDVANASRPISDSEVESCRAIGREPIEFRVGTDALAVVVSSANDFVDDVTMEEVALIFSSATNWSDVRSEWPEQAILRYIPGTDSGTFDYFVEEVFDADTAPILSAGNLQMSEDDNVLVQGVQGSPYSVTFFGYAYYIENPGVLKILNVDGVEPTAEHVEDGTYPLARPLFIYSTADIMRSKPQVADFINFYLTWVDEEVIDVGYFPASSAALNAARQAFLDAVEQ
jgi:phosphate transport system substrate-binding protein